MSRVEKELKLHLLAQLIAGELDRYLVTLVKTRLQDATDREKKEVVMNAICTMLAGALEKENSQTGKQGIIDILDGRLQELTAYRGAPLSSLRSL